jgi:hypothetical protein
MFVVVSILSDEHDTKAFLRKGDAVSFADQQIENGADSARVYEVPGIDDAREAISAVEQDEAAVVYTRERKASAAEIRREVQSMSASDALDFLFNIDDADTRRK